MGLKMQVNGRGKTFETKNNGRHKNKEEMRRK